MVTDKDGNTRVISTKAELKAWLETLSEEDRKLYRDRYRFEPVRNRTGIIDYTGTLRDL